MHGTFWFGWEFKDLIFYGLDVSSLTGFVLVGTFVFGITLFYESLKICLALLKLKYTVFFKTKGQQCISDVLILIENQAPLKSQRYCWLLAETSVYTIEVICGYILMLLVMTYNSYFLVIVLLGSGLVYSLFGERLFETKMKMSKMNLSCNACDKPKKCSTPSSSAEAISESVTDHISPEANCCSQHASATLPQIS